MMPPMQAINNTTPATMATIPAVLNALLAASWSIANDDAVVVAIL
jgi:hypothetical protein